MPEGMHMLWFNQVSGTRSRERKRKLRMIKQNFNIHSLLRVLSQMVRAYVNFFMIFTDKKIGSHRIDVLEIRKVF